MKVLKGNDIYLASINGARQVMANRDQLNKINVFPVRDGDTGSNLYAMMNTITRTSRGSDSVGETMNSIADAALSGARGNSGIIFAQYLNGLSMEIGNEGILTPKLFALASEKAALKAYESIENPVEGTMITVMRSWGQSLMSLAEKEVDFVSHLTKAYDHLEEALRQTQYQLEDLRRAGVVDSGAKGFVYFIKGLLDYLRNGMSEELEDETVPEIEAHLYDHLEGPLTFRYCTECLIEKSNLPSDTVRAMLTDLGDSMVVAGNERISRVHIHTDKPTEVFERLHGHGSITYQKVDDMQKQRSIAEARRADIAVITDSIADLPMSYVDEHQIHMLHLNILSGDSTYIDKMTVTPERILDISESTAKLPTSSQPDIKQIENMLLYLSTYYKELLIVTVSGELSGTNSNISKVASDLGDRICPVKIIDSKQNSGAQGLLVKKAIEMIESGAGLDETYAAVQKAVPKSKILVRVKTLDNMVKSGRLSVRAGKIGKKVGLKPIVTLDSEGKGALDTIALSTRGSLKKLIKHVKKIQMNSTIDQYSIVHVGNEKEALEFSKYFTELIGKPPVFVTETSSIVAVGAGRGAVALSYIIE